MSDQPQTQFPVHFLLSEQAEGTTVSIRVVPALPEDASDTAIEVLLEAPNRIVGDEDRALAFVQGLLAALKAGGPVYVGNIDGGGEADD